MNSNLLGIAVLLAISGCSRKDAYEFHTAAQGALMWRCNHRTGDVDYCIVRDAHWVHITNPGTLTYEQARETQTVEQLLGPETDSFGGILIEPHKSK